MGMRRYFELITGLAEMYQHTISAHVLKGYAHVLSQEGSEQELTDACVECLRRYPKFPSCSQIADIIRGNKPMYKGTLPLLEEPKGDKKKIKDLIRQARENVSEGKKKKEQKVQKACEPERVLGVRDKSE